jgi:lipopolysaccharide biosynthesis protein
MGFFRTIVSAHYWLLDTDKSIHDIFKFTNRNKHYLEENSIQQPITPTVITAHVYYPELGTQILNALATLPQSTKVLVTSPSQAIKNALEAQLRVLGNPHEVRLTPNVGRNFGPLLVEFSKQLLQEENFIHVHSKRSPHSPKIAEDWMKRNLSLLVTKEGIQRIQSLSSSNPRIGLVCADASDLVRGINFRWGRSLRIAKRTFAHFSGFEKVKWRGKLTFPVGGMFWVKTNSIRPLLEFDWGYEMFPAESGQGDGTLQHAIERMVGQLCLSREFQVAELDPTTDRFSLTFRRN